jgi:hypothetical protein
MGKHDEQYDSVPVSGRKRRKLSSPFTNKQRYEAAMHARSLAFTLFAL